MKLTGLTPNIFTAHIDRSTAFYRDVLGFAVKQTVPPDEGPFVFVWLERDGVTLFLNDEANTRKESQGAPWLAVGKTGVTIFIHMEGIDDLWAEVKDRAPVVMPLIEQWYGLTEFSIQDPDGYVVTFAERKNA
jgi:uncharacterized glyoxalase superfamily protein PhnB